MGKIQMPTANGAATALGAALLEGMSYKDGLGMRVAAVFATLFTYGNELV